MNNSGHLLRLFIAAVGPFLGMFQYIIRYKRSKYMSPTICKKERAGALSTCVILVGVGWGNFTHSYLPVQVSTIIVAIGIVLAIWANFRLLQTVRSESASTHDSK